MIIKKISQINYEFFIIIDNDVINTKTNNIINLHIRKKILFIIDNILNNFSNILNNNLNYFY